MKGTKVLEEPLQLPCGVTLKNRLIKSAMSDSLGDGAGNPTSEQIRLYERWAQGGVALAVIGEVQTDPRYPEKPGNLVLTQDTNLDAFENLTRKGTLNGAHLWVQLGNAGALAHPPISVPKGPSALALDGLECAQMSREDISKMPRTYAESARRAKEAGFTGVQIHAAHGFLLSQFLSPLFNKRADNYGGDITNRMRIVLEIIEAVCAAVGEGFPVGIKINASDKLVGGLDERDSLEAVRMLDGTNIDLIDISAGTYFPGAQNTSDATCTSGPYFTDFAARTRGVTGIPVMATGGFRTREHVIEALEQKQVDAVGLARAMVLDVNLADKWLNGGGDSQFPIFDKPVPGGVTAWYTMRLTALARDEEGGFCLTPEEALEAYEARDWQRCERWRKKFSKNETKCDMVP